MWKITVAIVTIRRHNRAGFAKTSISWTWKYPQLVKEFLPVQSGVVGVRGVRESGTLGNNNAARKAQTARRQDQMISMELRHRMSEKAGNSQM
jgi:hypothetical protein